MTKAEDLDNFQFQQFYIALGDTCNLKCIMCTTTTHPYSEGLSLEKWKCILDGLLRFKVEQIAFGGGEPLLRSKDLKELVNLVAEKGIAINIVTNATLLEEDFLQAIIKYREKVVFLLSLDGLEEVNDMIRGKGVFRKVIAAADLLQEYRWPFCFTSVLMPENFLGYIDFIKFLNKNYSDIPIDIQPVIPQNEIYYNRQKFELDKVHLEALSGILSFLHANKDTIKLTRPLRLIDKYWDYFTNILHTENQCKMGTKSFNINLRGNIWICGKELEYPLYQYKLEEVLATKEYLTEMKRVENCKSSCFAGLVI